MSWHPGSWPCPVLSGQHSACLVKEPFAPSSKEVFDLDLALAAWQLELEERSQVQEPLERSLVQGPL